MTTHPRYFFTDDERQGAYLASELGHYLQIEQPEIVQDIGGAIVTPATYSLVKAIDRKTKTVNTVSMATLKTTLRAVNPKFV
jgi:hypothetical protein